MINEVIYRLPLFIKYWDFMLLYYLKLEEYEDITFLYW